MAAGGGERTDLNLSPFDVGADQDRLAPPREAGRLSGQTRQLIPEQGEVPDLAGEGLHPFGEKGVDMGTGQIPSLSQGDDFPDLGQAETKCLRLLDKAEEFNSLRGIEAVSTLTAQGRW